MATRRFLSRPESTSELVERLKILSSTSDNKPLGKEAVALLALSHSMVQVFHDDRRVIYAPEVAALSKFVDEADYESLLKDFVKALAVGARNATIPDAELLAAFNTVLRSPQSQRQRPESASHIVSYAMKSLTTYFKTAASTNDSETQYQLLCSLSAVLDAMNEVKAKGISDVDLIQPLLELLNGTVNHPELRIAQAARYAYQALLGIPSDVSPWKKLWDETYKTLKAGAKVAGSVSSMDPSELLEGLENLAASPALVKSIIEVVEAMSTVTESAGGMRAAVKNIRKPASWYIALRYTDMLVRGNGAEHLKALLKDPKFTCRQDKEFLCGLCAQLEQAIWTKTVSSDDEVIKVLEAFLVEQGKKSKDNRVREWVRLIADATHRPNSIRPDKPSRLRAMFRSGTHEHGTTEYSLFQAKAPQGRLLSEAWKDCHEAQVFYADQMLQDYYTGRANLLKIKRLNEKSLPMDRCYINLAILEDSTRKGEDELVDQNTPSPFALHRRLQIWEPPASNRLSLPDLFKRSQNITTGSNSRGDLENRSSAPVQQSHHMRILIRGQAGVGKSTLCKKMVYDFIHNSMWTDIIDRIIWLPLRNIKKETNRTCETVEQLLCEEIFRKDPVFANSLWKALEKDGSRTLFILDGLDEVCSELDSGSALLKSLLDQPRVIITTRPYAINWDQIENIDLQLETVGFYPDQVAEYIAAVAPENSSEIQAFIKSHRVVEDLSRIPIQLDAICYSLDSNTIHTRYVPKSMTELYSIIIDTLWDKDVSQLGKMYQGQDFTKFEALRSNPEETKRIVQSEINMLQALAFSGLCNNAIEFGMEYRKKFLRQREKVMRHLPTTRELALLRNLEKTSFLRTSDGKSISETSSYHFLHLTFQEFFAAQFFVEHWKSGNSLSWILNNGETSNIKVEVLLGNEKYNGRYYIFWRFVVGLLQDEGDERQLCRFFETIESEPLDLFGPVHRRLVMHCLSEVSTQIPLRERLEGELKMWLLSECALWGKAHLSESSEFPERSLRGALLEGSDDTKVMILKSLHHVPVVPPFFNELGFWLRQDEVWTQNMFSAFMILAERTQWSLSDEILAAVVQRLGDEDSAVRRAAFWVLQRQPNLSDEILAAVAQCLGNEDSHVRWAALRVLQRQSNLSDEILTAVAQCLGNEDSDVRWAALRVLQRQSNFSDEILAAVVQQLGNKEHWQVLNSVKRVLKEQSISSTKSLMDVVGQLCCTDPCIQSASLEILLKQSPLSDEVLLAIAQRLNDLDREVHVSARDVLLNQPSLPDGVINIIVQLLDNEDIAVQMFALYILQWQSGLSHEILMAVVQKLDDKPDVCSSALDVLAMQRGLSHEILMALVKKLDDHPNICSRVLGVLKKQSGLSHEILMAVVQKLDDDEQDIRSGALRVLKMQSGLSHEIIMVVVQKLDDEARTVRDMAGSILRKHSELSNEVIATIVKRLDCKDDHLRIVSLRSLRGQSRLSDDTLTAVSNILEDEGGSKVGMEAEAVLRNHEKFYNTLLNGPRVGALYECLFHRAMEEHWSWCIVDGRSVLNTPGGAKSASIDDMGEFMAQINVSRRALEQKASRNLRLRGAPESPQILTGWKPLKSD